MRMLSSSVRLFTRFSTRRLSNLVPKNQFSCVNRYYTKYSKYYGGFTVSDIEMKRINALKETMKIPAVNNQYSSDNYLNGFKKQLQTLEDPVKKYDHLMALREQDINLYYNFLCNNTSEVLTILYAVDNIIQKYRRLLVGQKLSQVIMKETKKKPLKPLDPPDTIEYLKKRIREIKKRESEKVKKVVKSSASWIKRPLMISPEKCLMVYLKTN